jgi:thioredoxin-dependent peroxiredoxin
MPQSSIPQSLTLFSEIDAATEFGISAAAFANRIAYIISPEGKILFAYSDSNAEKHIENTLAVVRKWHEEHNR